MDLRERTLKPPPRWSPSVPHGSGPDPSPAPAVEERSGWPDGRRKFGTVSGAIISALERSGPEMSVKAVREEVEAHFGGTVSRFSISDYLLRRSKGLKPLFIRTRHGRYGYGCHATNASPPTLRPW